MQTQFSLGKKIKFARRSVGLSQKQLALVLKVSDKAVSAYEVGRAAPSIEAIREISRVTAKPISYFISEAIGEEKTLDSKIDSIQKDLAEIKALLARQFGTGTGYGSE